MQLIYKAVKGLFMHISIIFLNLDIDECQENKITGGHDLCSPGSTCVNRQGDYTCVPPKTRPIAIGKMSKTFIQSHSHLFKAFLIWSQSDFCSSFVGL